MEISVCDTNFKITKNSNNRFWKPIGMFGNLSEVKIGNVWYNCYLDFDVEESSCYVEIYGPHLLTENSLQIESMLTSGLYDRIKLSWCKMQIILYLLNRHKINHQMFGVKNYFFERLNMFLVFSISLLISFVFYIYNIFNDNNLIKYIAENIFCQSVLIFFTISSFVNIFYPFSFRKELSEKDIELITRKTIKRVNEEDELCRKASF